MDSYAYNPKNIGHLYINSQQLEKDLEKCAEETKKENEHGHDDGEQMVVI